MRRSTRRTLNRVLLIGVFVSLTFSVYSYILPTIKPSSIVPSTVTQENTTPKFAFDKPVIENLLIDNEATQVAVKLAATTTSNTSKGGATCVANGIPGDCSLAVGHVINGKLLEQVPDSVRLDKILSEKNGQGLKLAAAANMKYEYQPPTPSNSTVKPEVKTFSICEPNSETNKGVAQLIVKPLVLPPYLTEPDVAGMRQMTNDELYVAVSAVWFNNLSPERAEELCDAFSDPDTEDYNQMWSGQIGKAGGGAANASKAVLDYIVGRCSTRSPGIGIGDVNVFSKEYLKGHKDEKSVTFKLILPDNVKEDQFEGRELAVKKLDLSGTIQFAGSRLFQLYAWQPEEEADYRKMKNIGIAITMLYDMLAAAPQYSTGFVGKTDTAAKEGSLLTVPKDDDKKQMETSRETILSAVTGGLWKVDEKLYSSPDKASFLSFNPKTRSTNTAYCSSNNPSMCHLVASQSNCRSFSLSASAEVEGLYLSGPDLQEYAKAVQKGDTAVSYAFNRAGDSFQGGITRGPSVLDQATVEQVVLASGRATATCAEYLQNTIAKQRSLSKPLGVNEDGFKSLTTYWKRETYWNQGALAIPTRVSAVAFNDYKPNNELLAFLKLVAPAFIPAVFRNCDSTFNPSLCVEKVDIPEKYVPTLMNIKLSDAYAGANTEAPVAKNAKPVSLNQMIRNYFKRHYILPLDDFKIDCSADTISESTNSINTEIWQNMWICQTSGELFTQCQ